VESSWRTRRLSRTAIGSLLDSTWFVHDDRVWRDERKVYTAARDAGVLTEPQLGALEALWSSATLWSPIAA
jgi:hypothetical protein